MKKKKFLSLCFALLLAASSVAANAAGRGLVVPSASCVSNLNPLLENYREGAIMLNPLYDPLYVKDVGETRFYLAKSYEVSADGTVFTLTLKDGLKWHDGEPIRLHRIKKRLSKPCGDPGCQNFYHAADRISLLASIKNALTHGFLHSRI